MNQAGSNDQKRPSPMAFAAAFAFIMPIAVGLAAQWDKPHMGKMIAFLFDWQTLIAGILAIAAAAIGGLFILHQTRESTRQDAARVARKHAASRAVLPISLSAIIEFAEDVGPASRSSA